MKLSNMVFAAFATLVGSTQAALALDDCVVGTWNADISELVRQMEEGLPGIPMQMDITGFSGSVMMTVNSDMRYQMLTEDVVIKQNVDGAEIVMQMNGDNTGSIDANDGAVSIVTETFDVDTVVNMAGQQMVVPPRPEDAGPEAFEGAYRCTEDELVLLITIEDWDPNVPAPLLPHRWTR